MANWLTTKGFDFRATSDFSGSVPGLPAAEDANNRVFVGDTAQVSGDYGGQYPTTRTLGGDSITYGWVTDIPTVRDRNSANPQQLMGIHFAPGSANVLNFRVDLPAVGNYKVRLAIGDNDGGHTPMHVLILDNTTTLLTRNEGTVAADTYVDAGGTVRTDAGWVSSNVQVSLTFATTTFFMRLDATVDLTTIAHLELEQVIGGGASTLWAASVM
jgi:hypothetical protein